MAYDPGFDPNHPDPNDPFYQDNSTEPVSTTSPPPGANPPPTTSPFFDAAGKFNGDYQGYFNSLIAGKPATSDTLRGLAADLQKAGITIEPANAAGASSKIKFPDGRVVRVGNYFDGGGTASWGWTDQPGAAGGGGGPQIDPSFLSPYTQSFKDFYPHAFGAEGAQYPGAFKAPTGQSILSDPSYQFREGRLKGGIENSAAARGLLNSGGTIDDIMSGVGNFASQEYGNIWNRDFNLWNTDYQHADNAYARAWQQYMDTKKTFYDNQDRPFDKIYKGIDTGYNATV